MQQGDYEYQDYSYFLMLKEQYTSNSGLPSELVEHLGQGDSKSSCDLDNTVVIPFSLFHEYDLKDIPHLQSMLNRFSHVLPQNLTIDVLAGDD